MTYDVHYFIAKFEATSQSVCRRKSPGGLCSGKELSALVGLLWDNFKRLPTDIWDKDDWGDSPRERILNALYEIRRREREHG